jgi:uncharacterized membrane protein YbjE (DUF340 family)
VTSENSKQIVWVTGGVMVGLTLLEYSTTFVKDAKSQKTVSGKKAGSAFTQVWTIVLAMLILGFLADQIPQVVGPFALLILVAYVYKKEPEIQAAWKSAHSGSSQPFPNG